MTLRRVITVLIVFLLLYNMLCIVNGEVDQLLMAILKKTKPGFSIPPLEVYREKVVSKLVDFEKCNTSINFVAQYSVVQNIEMLGTYESVPVEFNNKTIFPPLVEVYEPFTRLPIRVFTRWIYEKYVRYESMSRLEVLHTWVVAGIPILNYRSISIDRALYLYLDEILYAEGYLYALKWYIRFNETHLIDLDIALNIGTWRNPTVYVYCPIPGGQQFREAFKITEYVTTTSTLTTTSTTTIVSPTTITVAIPTTVVTPITVTTMVPTTITSPLTIAMTIPTTVRVTETRVVPTTVVLPTTITTAIPTTILSTVISTLTTSVPTTLTVSVPTTMLLTTTHSTTVVSLSTSTVTKKITDWALTSGLATALLVVGLGIGLTIKGVGCRK